MPASPEPDDAARAEFAPSEAELELTSASYSTKQLIVLAADVVLESVSSGGGGAAVAADRLVERRILPACYRRRYDATFLERLHNVVEQARNALVSDLPFLANTASELAAHAIFTEANGILSARGEGRQDRAAAVDPSLPERLAAEAPRLTEELDSLFAATIEDADVLALFDLPADQEPDEHVTALGGPAAWFLLRFENWFVPFGAPRPQIAYDGRAWPAGL